MTSEHHHVLAGHHVATISDSIHAVIEKDEIPEKIAMTCDRIKTMLLEKNRKYGNSALCPIRIFSKADAIEQLKIRIDDKISRVRNRQDDEDEDVLMDLAGYLVLLVIAKGGCEE